MKSLFLKTLTGLFLFSLPVASLAMSDEPDSQNYATNSFNLKVEVDKNKVNNENFSFILLIELTAEKPYDVELSRVTGRTRFKTNVSTHRNNGFEIPRLAVESREYNNSTYFNLRVVLESTDPHSINQTFFFTNNQEYLAGDQRDYLDLNKFEEIMQKLTVTQDEDNNLDIQVDKKYWLN